MLTLIAPSVARLTRTFTFNSSPPDRSGAPSERSRSLMHPGFRQASTLGLVLVRLWRNRHRIVQLSPARSIRPFMTGFIANLLLLWKQRIALRWLLTFAR
jgi:hypothetical protein